LLLGGSRVIAGSLTVGTFFMFWLYFGKLTDPIRQLGEKSNVLQSAIASTERIFTILDRPQGLVMAASPRQSLRGPAEIAFEDVHFGYTPDQPVLRGVSFTARTGETVA